MTTTTDSPPAVLYAPDFFRTNHILTDGEQKLIKQHLDYAEANLLDVVDRIQDLSRQQKELIDCIKRCRVALAPIKNLPDDVLRNIFIICCDSPTEFLSRDPNPFVSTLCQVCSAWRDLALETPVLWSQISLIYDWSFSYPRIPSYVEDAVKLWFARANTCPISLEAGIRSYSLMAMEQGLMDLVGRIFALRSRYRKLVLKFNSNKIDVLLEKLSLDQLWHLEELETIVVGNANELDSIESLNLSLSYATPFPNLKKLIDVGHWKSNNLSILLPFPRLQVLNIQTSITMSLVFELFQQCPLLETCQVVIKPSDSTIRSWLANRTSYITLPQLRNLWMRFDSTEDCCRFIDQLVLSNLQSLMIFAANEIAFHPNEMAEDVVALSQRSGTPNIREIYFNRPLVPILDPGILLQSLPHLEKLVTYGCVTMDEGTLDGLAMGTIGCCLSNLHADDIEADLPAITRMAKQRGQIAGLNKLWVTTSKSVLDEFGWNDWGS